MEENLTKAKTNKSHGTDKEYRLQLVPNLCKIESRAYGTQSRGRIWYLLVV